MSFWERVRVLTDIGHEPLGFLKTWVLFLKNEARATHKISVNLALPIPSRENASPASASFASRNRRAKYWRLRRGAVVSASRRNLNIL